MVRQRRRWRRGRGQLGNGWGRRISVPSSRRDGRGLPWRLRNDLRPLLLLLQLAPLLLLRLPEAAVPLLVGEHPRGLHAGGQTLVQPAFLAVLPRPREEGGEGFSVLPLDNVT